jgi:hypothetical protein
MKIKKSTTNVLLSIGLIIILVIIGARISTEAKLTNLINERNIYCSNLSNALNNESGISGCFCYFEGFKTGDSNIDSKTLPLCACECNVNGTVQKIGILESRK